MPRQIKLSEAAEAKLAGKTPEQIVAILENYTDTPPEPPAAATPPAPPVPPAAPDPIAAQLAAMAAEISGLKAKMDTVVTEAKAAAANAVSKALAGTGQSAPTGGAATESPTEQALDPDTSDPKALWAKLPSEKKAEFFDSENNFLAYEAARRAGAVKIKDIRG